MAWTRKNLFIGAHLWFIRSGTAFTSPAPGTVSATSAPDVSEPLWPNYSMGVIESMQLDPKFATAEEILAPMPGHLVLTDKIIPYSTPLIHFVLKEVPKEAIEMALNSGPITDATTSFNPTAGTSGIRGYLRAQKYDQGDNLILNYQVWCFLTLKSALKMEGKSLTKPEFEAALLYSGNNLGAI